MKRRLMAAIIATITCFSMASTAMAGDAEIVQEGTETRYDESSYVAEISDNVNDENSTASADENDTDTVGYNSDDQDSMNSAESQLVSGTTEDETDSIPNAEISEENTTASDVANNIEYETAEEMPEMTTEENEETETMLEEEVTEESLDAQGIVDTGSAGDSCTWTLYEDGRLVISGTGQMHIGGNGQSPIQHVMDKVKSVEIQDGITDIGSCFFSGANITEFAIPDSVTTIRNGAFYGLSEIISINIPASVTTINEEAFVLCSSLASIYVDAANPYYVSVDGVLYDSAMTTLVTYPMAKQDNAAFTVPASVTRICSSAFEDNFYLTEINLPENLTEIGSYAFCRCRSLTEIIIPDAVVKIDEDAFRSCSSLKKVIIGKNVNCIGEFAFSGCANIEYLFLPKSLWYVDCGAFENVNPDTIEFGGTESKWKLINFDSSYDYNKGIVNGNVTYSDDSEYSYSGSVNETVNWELDENGQLTVTGSGCVDADPWGNIKQEIKTVVIGEGITGIFYDIFMGCSNLTSVIINEGVTKIWSYAFADCENLTDIQFPVSLESIQANAFKNDTNITSVRFAGTEAQWKKVGINNNTYVSESNVICSDTDENAELSGTNVQEISLDHISETMAYGSQMQLTATVLPETAVNKNIKWQSSDSYVASVDENGLVTATGYGTAVIKAVTEDGGLIAKCSISVYYSGDTEKGYEPEEGVFPETDLEGSAAAVDTSSSLFLEHYTITDDNTDVIIDTGADDEYIGECEIQYEGQPIEISYICGEYSLSKDTVFLLSGDDDVNIELSGSNVSKKLIEKETSKTTYLTLADYDYESVSHATNMVLINLSKRLGTPLHGEGYDLAIDIPMAIEAKYSLEEVQKYSSATDFVNGTGFWDSDEKFTELIGTLDSCSDLGVTNYEQMLEYVKNKMQKEGAAGYIVKNEGNKLCYYIYFNFTEKQVIDAWAAEMDTWEGHWQKYAFGITYDVDGSKSNGLAGYYYGSWGNNTDKAVGAYTTTVNNQYEYTITGPGTVTVKLTGVNLFSGSIVKTITVTAENQECEVNGHKTSVTKSSTAATLFSTGLTEELTCSVCGEITQAQTEIPMQNLTRTLTKGASGDDVKQVQQKLAELGYLTATPDGVYGAKTEAAVNEFQKANGLASPDGKVGNWTLNKLRNNPVAKSSDSGNGSSATTIALARTLKKGMTGDDVLAVQKRLYELGYLTATPDGSFGAKTEAAVRDFQIANGLGYSDGMVGNWTVTKLNGNPVAKSSSAAITKIVLTRTLKKGMSGDDVLAVQKRLYELGYLTATPDGSFGAKTEAAVRAFQIANGLGYSDGMVGNWTVGKLNGNPIANK